MCLGECRPWPRRLDLTCLPIVELSVLFSPKRNSLGLSRGVGINMLCFSAFSMGLVGGLALVFQGKVTFAPQVCTVVVPSKSSFHRRVWTHLIWIRLL